MFINRKAYQILAVCFVGSLQTACTSTYPSLDGPFGLWAGTEHIPKNEIAAQVACELREFLSHDAISVDKVQLDKKKPANISLNLQTEVTGSVAYLGIDLSVLSLDKFITLSSGRSSLLARIQGRTTVSSQLDFNLPQTLHAPKEKKTERATKAKGNVSKKFFGLLDAGVDVCEGPLTYSSRLGLHNELRKFFLGSATSNTGVMKLACQHKLTYKTGLQILVGAGVGVLPLGTSAAKFLVPVNLLNADLAPAFTHTLTIVFNLADTNNPGVCPGGGAGSST